MAEFLGGGASKALELNGVGWITLFWVVLARGVGNIDCCSDDEYEREGEDDSKSPQSSSASPESIVGNVEAGAVVKLAKNK